MPNNNRVTKHVATIEFLAKHSRASSWTDGGWLLILLLRVRRSAFSFFSDAKAAASGTKVVEIGSSIVAVISNILMAVYSSVCVVNGWGVVV